MLETFVLDDIKLFIIVKLGEQIKIFSLINPSKI